jgi:hypothetical protein
MPNAIFGRRIHISGSVSNDSNTEDVVKVRKFIEQLVKELLQKGATFVVPVDAEKLRDDQQPYCFDWLVWKTISENLNLRPSHAPSPLAVAVKHHKNDAQIPAEYAYLWDKFSQTDNVCIDSAAHWNMNSKRMELQARHGDILITIGGGEGVLFLANAYHDAGKPVIPIAFPISTSGSGTHKLLEFASLGKNADKLFRTRDETTSLTWLNRITTYSRKDEKEIAGKVMQLLAVLERPSAFAVRLLNQDHTDYGAVQEFFEVVVKVVLEVDYGYSLTVVDGKQLVEESRIDQDIFVKLRRSSLVMADLTAERPNCFLELGYAMGRGARTIVTARYGTKIPFDVSTYASHIWKDKGDVTQRRTEFREHIESVKNRPTITSDTTLIP